MTRTTKIKVRRGITGMAEFPLPDSSMSLLWTGPGSHRLYLTTPKGQMIPVDHPSGHLPADTLKAAADGARAFIEAGEGDD